MRLSLTDRFCAGAKAGKPQVDYFDEGPPGLCLRVTDRGRKSWTFLFTSPKDDKRARITLGRYPQLTLAQARTLAIEIKGHLAEGRDPRDVLASQDAGVMTVAALFTSYLEKHVRPNLRSAKAMERRFDKNVSRVIGGVKLADLHRRDVNRVVDPILKRKSPVEAARVFEDLRALLRWAVARGDLDRNPMDGMKKPATSQPRERVLSDDEIRILWNGLPRSLAKSKTCQRILKLCLVTAQRVGEVSGMQLSELDLKTATWEIPGTRTKNGYKHSVPLSALAVEIIREAIADAAESGNYVFPNLDADSALPPSVVARTITLAHQPDERRPSGRFGIDHWTAHDLRRTAVSKMAQLGVTPIVLGHVINHRSVTKAGVTLAVYSHYDYAKEKREALELWAGRLQGITAGGAEVVAMRGRGAPKLG
jgi:integrase